MNTRLYSIDVNKDEWIVTGNRDIGYKLTNKKDCFTYSISGDIIGIEQLDYNTFLVFKTIISTEDEAEIYKVKLDNGKNKIEFKHSFKKHFFLSDDNILFDNRFVYSISKNKKVKEFEWLSYKDIEVQVDENGEIILFVEERIFCFPEDEYVQFLVDTENFKPIKQIAYSTLRNKLINLSDNFKLDDLIAEDNYYAKIISDHMLMIYYNSRNIGRSKILTKKQAKNIYTKMN